MKRTKTPTSEYAAFQAQIRATPYDPGAWQMSIDWLQEQGRMREARVAGIALQQRLKFGPCTIEDWRGHHAYSADTQINRFVLACRRILHPELKGRPLPFCATDRMRRFHARCKFQTRTHPVSGLPQYRVVGPDPAVHPLDCPPLDERRRFTRWTDYPDGWYCVWVNHSHDPDGWAPVFRSRRLLDCCSRGAEARDGSGGVAWYVVRDQDGRVEHRQPPDARLPEDEFPQGGTE